MGTTSDMVLVSMSTVGFASSGLYVLLTLVEIRACGGVRRYVRATVRKAEDAERAIEQELED